MLFYGGQIAVKIMPDAVFEFRDIVRFLGAGQAFRRDVFGGAKKYPWAPSKVCHYTPMLINEDTIFAQCVKEKYADEGTLLLRHPSLRIKMQWGGNVFRKVFNVGHIPTNVTTEYKNLVINFLKIAPKMYGDVLWQSKDRPKLN